MRLDKITKELDELIFVTLPQNQAWDIIIIDVLMILYSRSRQPIALSRIADLREIRIQIMKNSLDWEMERIPIEEMK